MLVLKVSTKLLRFFLTGGPFGFKMGATQSRGALVCRSVGGSSPLSSLIFQPPEIPPTSLPPFSVHFFARHVPLAERAVTFEGTLRGVVVGFFDYSPYAPSQIVKNDPCWSEKRVFSPSDPVAQFIRFIHPPKSTPSLLPPYLATRRVSQHPFPPFPQAIQRAIHETNPHFKYSSL